MKQQIEKILRHHKKKTIIDKNLKSSAVLILLFYNQGQYWILFTERSKEVDFHKGQVCFPGGTQEPSDSSLLQTALRETEEEIGLKAEDAKVLGELDDTITLNTGYLISPFVAFIPYPYLFKANQREVEQIFSIPLSAFLEGKVNFRQDYYPTKDKSGPGYAYEYEGHIIWGATARILTQLIALLKSESGALE